MKIPAGLLAIGEWELLDQHLSHDVGWCEAILAVEDPESRSNPNTLVPWARRQLVRAVFALVEAGVYRVKQTVVAAQADSAYSLSSAELALL